MISILLPTRKRKTALEQSVKSLLSLADNGANIEFVIAVDKDDSDTENYVKGKKFINLLKKYKTSENILTFEPLGYLNLYVYVNECAKMSQGNQLMFWNDDAEMLTKGWDTIIDKNANYFGCLRMPCVNMNHPFALFPIIPRKWLELFKCISPVNHSDWWIYNVCKPLNRITDIPVEVIHNRADVNGENNDETFANNSYLLDGHSPHDPRDYSHPDRIRDRSIWTETLMLRGYPHEEVK